MSQLVFETTELIMRAIEVNGELLDHLKIVMPTSGEIPVLQNSIISLGKRKQELDHLHPGVTCEELACGF